MLLISHNPITAVQSISSHFTTVALHALKWIISVITLVALTVVL